MRRLVLALTTVALLALGGTAGAGTARPGPRLVVVKGSARAVDGMLRGWFVVANRGTAASHPTSVSVTVAVGEPPSKVLRQWVVARRSIPPLAPSASHRVRISVAIPSKLAATRRPILACAERCVRIGHFTAGSWPTAGRNPAGSEGGSGAAGGATTKPSSPQPLSTVPAAPIPFTAGEPFHHTAGAVEYWGFVPYSYNASNLAPTPLLIWLHGCGGESSGDIWVVDPGADPEEPQDWMTLALGGREGGCWTPLTATEPMVMAALADFETHFNVDRRRVILGGYSSGGDLAYRTGFRHSSTFAGLLIENSSPFRDTESTATESLAAATTKLHIAHLAHTGDMTYPIEGVREEVGAVKAAGFPVELIERPGGHSDSHTDSDLRTYLLPHIDDGWLAPAP
jgi:hypothetical protein